MQFKMDPELRKQFQAWMVKKGYGIRNQSDAMNDLIRKALATEGQT
jgi:hypothetical protein